MAHHEQFPQYQTLNSKQVPSIRYRSDHLGAPPCAIWQVSNFFFNRLSKRQVCDTQYHASKRQHVQSPHVRRQPQDQDIAPDGGEDDLSDFDAHMSDDLPQPGLDGTGQDNEHEPLPSGSDDDPEFEVDLGVDHESIADHFRREQSAGADHKHPAEDQENKLDPPPPDKWDKPGLDDAMRDALADHHGLPDMRCEECDEPASARCDSGGCTHSLLCEDCADGHHRRFLLHSPKYWTGYCFEDREPLRPWAVLKHPSAGRVNSEVRLISLSGCGYVTVEHDSNSLFPLNCGLVYHRFWPITPAKCQTAISFEVLKIINALRMGGSAAQVFKALSEATGAVLPAGLMNNFHNSFRHWRHWTRQVLSLSPVMKLPKGCPGCYNRSHHRHHPPSNDLCVR
jgi:hypothetical protein